MESFLDVATAARLQYVTFPLELIGLALALIEVRFPKLADRITRQIEHLSTPIDELRSGGSGDNSVMERSLGTLLSRMLKAGFYIWTAVYLAQLVYHLPARGLDPNWLLGMLIGYVFTAIVMIIALVILGLTIFFLVVGGSDFARRFVAGRAIGTLGILIAGLGLLGELYQLLTQLVHS